MGVSVKKAKKLAKDAVRKNRKDTWKVFIGLCKFFSFTHNDVYYILKLHVDLDVWYGDFIRFKYTLLNNPSALMNKRDVKEVVDETLNELKDDMFAVMHRHSNYNVVREKWEKRIGG